MLRSLTYAVLIFLCPAGISLLSGCHSHKPAAKVSFGDQPSMLAAFRGQWILQAYSDSTDNGLTPKLLDYLLAQEHCIAFSSAQNNESSDSAQVVYIDDVAVPALFRSSENKILFLSRPAGGRPGTSSGLYLSKAGNKKNETGSEAGTAPGQLGTAEFIVSAGDTVLRFYDQRDPGTPLNFVKYDAELCPGVSPYLHLVCSRFIAGKYYNVTDAAKEHHIIFTKCGNVEGAGNIAPELSGHSRYDVKLTDFSTNPDILSLTDPVLKNKRSFYWEVDRDSLILHPDAVNDGHKSLVLVKAP